MAPTETRCVTEYSMPEVNSAFRQGMGSLLDLDLVE